MAPGRVVSVGQLGTYGLTVIIDHGGGDYSIYGSLDRADVRAQQTVTKGQVIGERRQSPTPSSRRISTSRFGTAERMDVRRRSIPRAG